MLEALPVRRLTAASLVLLLHAALIALLLHAIQTNTQPQSAVHETWLTLRHLAEVVAPRPSMKRSHASVHSAPAMPDYRNFTFPSQADGTSANSLHLYLFDCSPENEANLTQEQHAQCARAAPKHDDSVDYADHTNRSHDSVRWARGLARQQAPALLPCMSSQGIGVGLGTLACLGKGLTSGFDLDDSSGYGGGPPAEAQVPNGGDPPPPPTYNMRH